MTPRAIRRAAAAAVSFVVTALPAAAQRPLASWTRGSTCYEVFVRSFYDSNGDGIGDLNGLIAKLDYINDGNPHSTRSLGARCIWLMPVNQAASYHGYDATDYFRVEKEYGTNADFRRLVAAAHRRGIRVLVDMVLNHVSDRSPWFQSALRDTLSPYRNWFRWSKTDPGQHDQWGNHWWRKSPVRDEYYYGFFWGGMPDLNYENPRVVAEAKQIARFWLHDMGADGFRMDAVPYLIEQGDQVANTPATHHLLHEYNEYVHRVKADAYTVGEVSPRGDTLFTYYPDQLDSYFAFELSDSLVAAVRRGTTGGMLAPVLRLQQQVPGQRWSPFLRNHDEPRTRTELGGDMRRSRLASFVLLTMPGMPFVYYGEEIGMTGTKPDERIRTPMQWNAALPHDGFTTGTPWEPLQPDSAAVTVAAEEHDPASILTLERRMIHLRSENAALGTGDLFPLTASDPHVLAYLRRAGRHVALVVANLGDEVVTDASLAGAARALPRGRHTLRDLLGDAKPAALTAGADGAFTGYVPVQGLAPEEGYVFEVR